MVKLSAKVSISRVVSQYQTLILLQDTAAGMGLMLVGIGLCVQSKR